MGKDITSGEGWVGKDIKWIVHSYLPESDPSIDVSQLFVTTTASVTTTSITDKTYHIKISK